MSLFLSLVDASSTRGRFFGGPIDRKDVFGGLMFKGIPPLGGFEFLIVCKSPTPKRDEEGRTDFGSIYLLNGLGKGLCIVGTEIFQNGGRSFVRTFFRRCGRIKKGTSICTCIRGGGLRSPFFGRILGGRLGELHGGRNVPLGVVPSRRHGASGTAHVRTGLRPVSHSNGLVFGRRRGSSSSVGRLISRFQVFRLALPCPTSKPSYIRKKGETVSEGTKGVRGPIVVRETTVHHLGGCEEWAAYLGSSVQVAAVQTSAKES